MATRRVSIIDPSGSKKTQVELPDHVPTDRLLRELVPRMSLPPRDQAGRDIRYRLHYSRAGEEHAINPEQSLADVGIEDDDSLRLYTEMQGGGRRLDGRRP